MLKCGRPRFELPDGISNHSGVKADKIGHVDSLAEGRSLRGLERLIVFTASASNDAAERDHAIDVALAQGQDQIR